MTFKRIRIALLLIILVMVVSHQFSETRRYTSWDVPLFIAIYPINADHSTAAARTIEALRREDFNVAIEWLRDEAARHGVDTPNPVYFELGEAITNPPPKPPINGGFFQRALWVAKTRWWRFRFDDQGLDPDVIVLARYHDPERHEVLPHSVGVEQLRFAIANLFAGGTMRQTNHVVLVHELLHTLGATDKYDLATGLPRYPDGYAEPERSPAVPQRQAEIMAGRIAVSADEARQAEHLGETLVGPITAEEIGWGD